MRKWLAFSALTMLLVTPIVTMGVESGGSPATLPEPTMVTSDGGEGAPTEPLEPMADTTADIYIYVTLRQPLGPPAEAFWIDTTRIVTGSEYVRFKANNGPGDRADCDFYLIYRTPWAPFIWPDLWMYPAGNDSAHMIDPIEDPFAFSDAGQYRWYGGRTTFDYFLDTVWNDTIRWCTGVNWIGNKGVANTRVNWLYTSVAVDSNEVDGRLLFSPTPARPVGEFDQYVGCALAGNINLLSYPVEDNFVRAHNDTAKYFAQRVPRAVSLWEWDPATQRYTQIARKLGATWLNVGGARVKLGRTYMAILDATVTPADTFLFSMFSPGYLPYDTCFYFTRPAGWAAGQNIFMMPYQEYNILINSNCFPLEPRWLGDDIERTDAGIQPVTLWEWDPFTQRFIQIARKIGANWLNAGPAFKVYPGRTYMANCQGPGGYWPVCP